MNPPIWCQNVCKKIGLHVCIAQNDKAELVVNGGPTTEKRLLPFLLLQRFSKVVKLASRFFDDTASDVRLVSSRTTLCFSKKLAILAVSGLPDLLLPFVLRLLRRTTAIGRIGLEQQGFQNFILIMDNPAKKMTCSYEGWRRARQRTWSLPVLACKRNTLWQIGRSTLCLTQTAQLVSSTSRESDHTSFGRDTPFLKIYAVSVVFVSISNWLRCLS